LATIIVHGGAGSGKYCTRDRRFRELVEAVEIGRSEMRRGSSLDGVEAAVRHMESSGAFNAGRGACLTLAGTVELDAAVMTGEGRSGAGVGLVTCTYHPVSLARWVAERTDHVLVVGERCGDYARSAGLRSETIKASEKSKRKFAALSKEDGRPSRRFELWRRLQQGNTVGAVAIDSDEIPAAAVSTGGIWLKLPGRIGDSAIIGAGVYADSRLGAACATGTGEEIIKNMLSMRACELMRRNNAQAASDKTIKMLSRTIGNGSAGIITVDLAGRVGASCNTEAMGRAWYDVSKGRTFVRT
jgi:beta-aspartyl-peptidase (threonine type)